MSDEVVTMHAAALEKILQRSAEEGARRVLSSLGLDDHEAVNDVKELRMLLTAWRDAKQTARRTVVASLTKGFLLIILGGLGASGWHLWGGWK